MKTEKIILKSIKDYGWSELAYSLKFDKFCMNNPGLEEDELSDKFYTEVINKKFQYGEFANIEIIFDEDFNIIGGKIIDFKK